MINLQDLMAQSELFKKFIVDELLLVEFKCPIEDPRSSLWCNNNFFAFILTGEVVVKTPRHTYMLKSGDCFFVRKGGILIESEYQENFCELLVFVPDDFIRTVIEKHKIQLIPVPPDIEIDSVYCFGTDEVLETYFSSLLAYFHSASTPPTALLKLKFEELIVSILSSDKYVHVRNYFSSLCRTSKPSIREIMERNFSYNLSIDEFARLSTRSISSFKMEFKNLYHTTPARWLQQKRLEFSKYLIDTTDENINEIYFRCGYENGSHFVRVFKNKFGITPGQYKLKRNSMKSAN